jgi:hypothetical protein
VHSEFEVIDAFLAVLVVEQQEDALFEAFLASSHFAEASVATKARPATRAVAASIRNFMMPSFLVGGRIFTVALTRKYWKLLASDGLSKEKTVPNSTTN